MEDATPTEREAVLLRWRAAHPDAAPGSGPGEDESETLLREIRERAIQIENQTLGILMKKMRVRPSGKNSPSLRPFVFVLSVLVAAGILIAVANVVFRR